MPETSMRMPTITTWSLWAEIRKIYPDMLTVEAQREDVPHDMTPYTDIDGNTYDFAHGLNWHGIINDSRTRRYAKHHAE